MDRKLQQKAPIIDALADLRNKRIVPFDVPGHKKGRGSKELTEFLSKRTMQVDVNSMKPLDFLSHPVSIIKEAEIIAADAFSANHAFFMVGGTTSSVLAMIMATCKENDKILMPRNVHKSAINALILTGASPIYIDPSIDDNLGISLGMKIEDIERAIIENKDAKAIFLNNPTYYGICSNLKRVVELAHSYNILVLVDEAHGTHYYFNSKMPLSAMQAGADFASVSMHKSGGSLTQSAFLLLNKSINIEYTRQIINLFQTTSASYLLLSSLDISRKNLALNGEEIFDKVLKLAEYARQEINQIEGFYAFNKEIINNNSIYNYDSTKLSVNTIKSGLTGIEIYDILRDEYDIQIEFGDMGNFLAYISVGDIQKDVERLCAALFSIARQYSKNTIKKDMLKYEFIKPILKTNPKHAFYGEKRSVLLSNSIGCIACENIMCYPPGVPIIAPGEIILKESIDYIKYAKEKGANITGFVDKNLEYIQILK